MKETGHQEELQSIAEIVLACVKRSKKKMLVLRLKFYNNYLLHLDESHFRTKISKARVFDVDVTVVKQISSRINHFLKKTEIVHSRFSYLIPSGITIFFPISPSTSRTNGKSDSKLLTVKRRFTKEVIRR